MMKAMAMFGSTKCEGKKIKEKLGRKERGRENKKLI